MALLIDGHNLIGKTPWIDLGALDDEDELIRLLQEYARIRRKKIEVYFDQLRSGALRQAAPAFLRLPRWL